MYLKKSTSKKTGRTQLSIDTGYRDKDGKTHSVVVKYLGYLDILEKEYDDPIAHFKEVARQMTEEKKAAETPIRLELNKLERMTAGTDLRKNFGYLACSKIYHELGIHEFFANRQKRTGAKYNLNSVFRALVFSRVIAPDSKKGTFEALGKLFDKCDFSLDDVYRSLDIFSKYQSDLQLYMHENICKKYSRDTSLVYYDVTNYYFEIDEEDEMKRRGPSKEHRPDPIVQMGLFMDTNGLPISYGLFSGNTLDKQTLLPMMDKLSDNYNLGKAIIVADRGMITGDNITQIRADGNSYIFSYSIRGAKQDFKDYVLDENDYRRSSDDEDGFKIKSRTAKREIWVTDPIHNKRIRTLTDEKQVVFYSAEYAKKQRHERERVLSKAIDLINNPSKYNRATGYGAAKYISNINFDSCTGEILTNAKKSLELNTKLIEEEARYDGYYAILTNEFDKSDSEILDIYRGLWKIEETFKITKTGLEARPVYLKTTEHVKAHFLICFTALLIMRLMEYRIGRKYSVAAIIESLRKCECSLMSDNIYMFDYYDDVLKTVGDELGIDFSLKYRKLKEIKDALSDTKKQLQ